MSYKQPYFPPNGCHFFWHNKALNYSPWVCELGEQKLPGLFLHPARVRLSVDLIDGFWKWRVNITDFTSRRTEILGSEDDPLKACLAAEKVGEKALAQMTPFWVKVALKHGWRPPSVPTRFPNSYDDREGVVMEED